jgi:exopolyphosphatase/guanosine-5'-triphosphate,3'-diphosphate pyrophosphatase
MPLTDDTVSPPSTVAALDLGSNSFHLLVAELRAGQPHVVDRIKEMVRLAAGLDEDNNLAPEAAERALDCLARFGERLQGLPPGAVRAVGTNTLRQARGAGDFLGRAEAALGHPVEIISGMEEARLIYQGVAHSLAEDEQRRLVVDIGGGSTELIVGEGLDARATESLYMGCVSLSRRFFADGKITAKALQRAELAAHQELEGITGRFHAPAWEVAVGASGTIKAVEKVITKSGWAEEGIPYRGLVKLRDKLADKGHTDKLSGLKGLDDDRAPVFPGGVAILKAVFEALGIEHMRASDGALREGLLFDLVGRIQHRDVRDHSVASLAERFHVDPEQAERVRACARRLFDQIAEPWELPEEAGDLLEWAARLHEVGLDIAHSGYHKHGAYIAANADLAGFSQQEQARLAALIRAHRRKFPGDPFDALTGDWPRIGRRLAVLLRLATVLHRSRSGDNPPALELQSGKKGLHLVFPSGWLDERALLRADLEEEAQRIASGANLGLTFA